MQVLKPWAEPYNTPSLLLLDTFSAHQMTPVVSQINNLGIDVDFIGAGMTYINQPVDIGIGKPFKVRITNHWVQFVEKQFIEYQNAIQNGSHSNLHFRIARPTRDLVAQWVHDAWRDISTETVKNSWRHKPYHLVNEHI